MQTARGNQQMPKKVKKETEVSDQFSLLLLIIV